MKLLVVILVVASLSVGCTKSGQELSSAYYLSREDARKGGAFQSGWLPEEIPESATEIWESHNIDTGEVWVRFKFEDDIEGMVARCDPPNEVKFPDARRTKRAAAWWPAELVDSGGGRLEYEEIIVCPDMTHAGTKYRANLALNLDVRTAWYWIVK